MATKEPTTVNETPVRKVTGKVTNSRDITWPHDQFGFTSMLRKEGVRAVGRIKGDKEKLAVLIESLRVIAEHGRAKIVDQHKDLAQTEAAAKNRALAAEARSLEDQKREVKRLEGLLEAAKVSLAAKTPEAPAAEVK